MMQTMFEDQSSLLSSNLCCDADRNFTFKDNVGMPDFLFGTCISLETALKFIYEHVRNIVAQVPGTILNDTLGTSMILGCSDTAEMDSLPKKSKHVTSFSFVPVSFFQLISVCLICLQFTTYCCTNSSVQRKYSLL